MRLSVMTDLELVRQFMTLDEVWSLCTDDGVDIETYYPPSGMDRVWLGVYEGLEIVGMVYVHQQTSTTIQMHPYLLKGHKKKVRDLGKIFFEWAWSMPNIFKVNVTVPFIYHKLRNCCLKCGFKDEGINEMSYRKNGVLMNQWYMGAIRNAEHL